ncbi:MAG: hypothetical protein ACRD7E_09775 [Bryobacteraceae bacterium]
MALSMYLQARAILWAQWRSLMNHYGASHRSRFPFSALLIAIWYLLWTAASAGIGLFVSDADNLGLIEEALPGGLLVIVFYWQIAPILMVSSGLSLDLGRLLVYPIPKNQLFVIELLLRVTVCFEMLLITAALGIGFLLNPGIPGWGPFALLPFILFNLLLSSGMRDLLGRLLARKRVREALVFLLVMAAALPQLLLVPGAARPLERIVSLEQQVYWPTSATASLALGKLNAAAAFSMLLWTAAAAAFAIRQFRRSLRYDKAEARAARRTEDKGITLTDRLLGLPGVLFPDPLAGLVEKELRVLSRSARFRLVFVMGFSFGLVIWLPMAFQNRGEDSFISSNYLTLVSAYALMLLGEVCFWNTLGFDRSAAQLYFVVPVRISTVLAAKNITAVFFVFVEIVIIALVCALAGMPLTRPMVAESFSVTLVLTAFLLAIGNLISVRNPRPVDPAQSWRNTSAGRVQAFLLVIYPVSTLPILLAYGARYAFENELAFYGVLLFDLGLAAALYWVAMDSAAYTAGSRREEIIATLSRTQGPVGS